MISFIRAILQVLNEIFKAWNSEKDKQAGQNEEKLDEINEIEKRVADADKIYNDPVLDDIDRFLLRRKPKKFE